MMRSLFCMVLLLVAGRMAAQEAAPVMPAMIERFHEDMGILERTYPLSWSKHDGDRIRSFLLQWRNRLEEMSVAGLGPEDKLDYTLFRNLLNHEIENRKLQQTRLEEVRPMLPFADGITRLDEKRRGFQPVDPEAAAALLDSLNTSVATIRAEIKAGLEGKGSGLQATPILANRAFEECRILRDVLDDWYKYYAGYDPVFTWWVEAPYKTLSGSVGSYSGFLRESVVGIDANDRDAIIGDPIGREALLLALRQEMIAYSPEELIRIAETEYDWCETEMKKASRDLGFGDDWLKAVEYVKTLHVPPGKQPELIRDLAEEAVEFIEARDLVTVPPLAKETWRIRMMSAERQKVSPFFTGGEVISVAFPLDSMQHEQKMMSLRGNNIHFSRATVQHELIPGHALQNFMMDRYHPYRQHFWTPFWMEGWALYWEMRLWDLGFAQTPENRVGMLFWRMHRCARIVFSLSFHLGSMTPDECIDYLVKRVGHERDNAAAEVRRSFGGSYPPLYQVAYMVGALQFRALHDELVSTGAMSEREFHDRVLQENVMPVEFLHYLLTGKPVPANPEPTWRFYPGLP